MGRPYTVLYFCHEQLLRLSTFSNALAYVRFAAGLR